MGYDFFNKLNHYLDDDDDVLSVHPENNESIPDFIYEQMKEAGLFKDACNDKVDNYINENALEVILDLDFWRKNPNKFIQELKKAIDLGLDSIVDSVIENFPKNKKIVQAILASNKSKYIAKVIKMPLDLYVKMIEGKDGIDNDIKSFINSRKIAWWAPQHIIFETKNEKLIGFLLESLRFKLHLSYEELKSILANRDLFVEHFQGSFSNRIDVKLRSIFWENSEYVSMLLDCKYCDLWAEEQMKVLKFALSNKRDDLIFKMIESQTYVDDCIIEEIAKLGREDFILKIISRRDINRMDISPIINLGEKKYILRILEHDNLYVGIRQKIIKTKNLEYISILLEKFKDDICFIDFATIIRIGRKEHILEKLEKDECNWMTLSEIIKSGDNYLINKIMEKKQLHNLVQVDIVKYGNKSHIERLIKKSDVNWMALSEVIKSGDNYLINKIMEKKQLHNLVQVDIVKYGDKQQVFKLIERDDLSFLATEEIKRSGNMEYISKLEERLKMIPLAKRAKSSVRMTIEMNNSKMVIYHENGEVTIIDV